MPRATARDAIYRGRRFSVEVIELCVRWYITYRLSYRDLAAMMAERGVAVTHTTIMRWVLRYVPEYEKRWARFARPVRSSWRMDETSVLIRRAHLPDIGATSTAMGERRRRCRWVLIPRCPPRAQERGTSGLTSSTAQSFIRCPDRHPSVETRVGPIGYFLS
jgi:hypothetical protein